MDLEETEVKGGSAGEGQRPFNRLTACQTVVTIDVGE
jgi:hypothetical protein